MTEKQRLCADGAQRDGSDGHDVALDRAVGAALEEALDGVFTAVAHVRHVLHARDRVRSAADTLTPDTALAQAAYVGGMTLAERAQDLLAAHACRGNSLPPAWLAQGFVDTLAGTVRLDEAQLYECQAWLTAQLSHAPASCPADALRGGKSNDGEKQDEK